MYTWLATPYFKTTILAVLLLANAACQKQADEFEVLQQQITLEMDTYLQPITYNIVSDTLVQTQLNRCQYYLNRCQNLAAKGLTEVQYEQLGQLSAQLENRQLQLSEQCWNPALYDFGKITMDIIQDDYSDLNQRLADIYDKLADVTTYYTIAKHNIKDPSLPHTKTAIAHNREAYFFITSKLHYIASQQNWYPVNQQKWEARIEEARIAIKDYLGFCNGIRVRYGR